MNNEDRQGVFRGHFDECLKHLGKSIFALVRRCSEEATLAKKPVADFCGVQICSVSRWLRGTVLPIGEQYIKLMCYLDLVGYRVIELERMPKGRRYFAELIGFGLISSKQAAEQYGIVDPDDLREKLDGHRREIKRGIPEIQRVLTQTYKSVSLRNAALIKSLFEKYEDGDVMERQVNDVFRHVERLQKQSAHAVAEWKKRFKTNAANGKAVVETTT